MGSPSSIDPKNRAIKGTRKLEPARIVASSVGDTIWLVLLCSEDATILAGSSFLVPLIALFFGSILLGEPINQQSVLGSVLVLLGVYFVNVHKKNSHASRRTEISYMNYDHSLQ